MSGGMIITYETLFDILRREKARDELQELDEEFYANVAEYLQEKNKLLSTSGDQFMDDSEKIRIQIANIRKIVKELYERRERKVVNLALFKSRLNNKILDTRALLPEEKLLFEAVVGQLDENRNSVLNNIIKLRTPEKVRSIAQNNNYDTKQEKEAADQEQSAQNELRNPSETAKSMDAEAEDDAESYYENKMVRFINPVPKFLGTELEIYGPYEEEDVANLPSKIADVLIQKGRAEEIAK